MKVLITGGTGFIGSRLALKARGEGHDIVVAGQLNSDPERSRVKELIQAGVTVDQAPLLDAAYAQRLVNGREVVIHLAAAQHEANVADDYFFDVNVNGTQILLNASRAAGVRRFVYGSTIGVYGESAGQRPTSRRQVAEGGPAGESGPGCPQISTRWQGRWFEITIRGISRGIDRAV